MRRRLLLLAAALGALPAAGAGAPDSNPIVTTLALFAGTSSGLRLSRDWGVAWDPRDPEVRDGLETVGAVRAIVPLGPTVYLGGDGGLFRSDDFGRTWERLGVLGSVQCILLSRYFDIEPTMFVGTGEGLLKSEDGGRTFRSTGLRGTPVTRLDWPGPALVAATGRGVLVSMDAGDTFGGPGQGLPTGEVRAMALSSFYPIDPVLFAGGGNGVFLSGDGARTWKEAGLADHAVTDLAWMGPFLYACTDRGLYITQDMGKTWRLLTDGLADATPARIFFPAAPDSSAEAFVATDRGIFRTPDGGRHWLPTGFKDEAALIVAAFPPFPKLGRDKKK
jgi:photosystem II stability/assembly factor-like uncharacterized protein